MSKEYDWKLVTTKGGGKMLVLDNPANKGKIDSSREKQRRREVVGALNVLELLTLEFFPSVAESQQEYHYGLLEKIYGDYDMENPNEAFRMACARLGNNGVGADKASDLLLSRNNTIKTGIALGSISRGELEDLKARLADSLSRYYPSNFPKNRISPK